MSQPVTIAVIAVIGLVATVLLPRPGAKGRAPDRPAEIR